MTRRRWIADEVNGNRAALTGDHASHLARVLRARVGQEYDIAIGENVRLGTITSVCDQRVEFELGQEQPIEAVPRVTLVLAIFKFDRMEWAIEKCTEIGVERIVPVIARRTESHLASAATKRRERWERIARQASEQSRRATPPEIAPPAQLKDLGAATGEVQGGPRIVLTESERETSLREALSGAPNQMALAIGPEGGWSGDELKWFEQTGWYAASLGKSILRAETAAIVACALAFDALR